MTDALTDILSRMGTLAANAETPAGVWLSRQQPQLKELLPDEKREADGKLWGIPLHVSDAMPKGMGMLRSVCRCSFIAVMQDGGEMMHEAKRHTVILKFEE